MSKKKKTVSDNSPCEKCGGRTALVTGTFIYYADSEPYKSGVEEKADIEGGECYLSAVVCDKCGYVDNLYNEE